jgi:hypothetical protein
MLIGDCFYYYIYVGKPEKEKTELIIIRRTGFICPQLATNITKPV